MAANGPDVPGFLSMVLRDGGPQSYAKVASNYEWYLENMKWEAHKSVSEKWRAFHADVTNSKAEDRCVKHRMLDAACGTGIVAEILLNSAITLPNLVEIHGFDLCPEMLAKARAKGIYTNLQVVNLKETLPYESGFFDSITCSGVFTKGHCGPECLPNLVRVLKDGGYMILTCIGYTDKLFGSTEKVGQWKREIMECNCELVEDEVMPYRDGLESSVLVIRKLP